MKRSPLKRKTPLKKTSKKRARESKTYAGERRIFLALFPTCQFGDCWQRSTDVHHKNGRGKSYLDTNTWMAVCREHHDWIHSHSREARKLGLITYK